MIYKSIDTIPSKIYFKILESGNLMLLCSENETVPEKELIEIFNSIQLEDEKLTENRESNKELDIWKTIESLGARYKKVQYSVYYLGHLKDEDLIKLLEEDGYIFTDDYESSLSEIDRISESLLHKIDSIKQRLPKKKEAKETKKMPFDEVVLSYCALLNMGFTDTNTLVQSQYRAIIKMGNNKIESLNRSSNGRK